jgi:hypothetical protein
MKNTHEPVVVLSARVVERTVRLVRADQLLGDELSSWSTVAPTEWEATDRVRALVEFGVVPVTQPATPRALVKALRVFEATFLGKE